MNTVTYLDQVTSGPSRKLWRDCPVKAILEDPNVGYGFFDDFTRGGLITSPTTSASLVGLPYSGFGSAGSTQTYANALGGGIVLAETTDDEAVSIFSLSHCFKMGLSNKPLWFECSITPSHTATTEQAIFAGLADSTAKVVTVPLTATAGDLADLNLVGFHKLDTDLAVIKPSYKANGVAAVALESCAAALTAGTAVKLGFKKDRNGLVTFYVDGVAQSTPFQVLNDLGTGFPGDVLMAPCVAMHLGAAASDNTLTLNWWRCYQLRA